MIAELLDGLKRQSGCTVTHWEFNFTPDFKQVRSGGLAKLRELVRVLGKLIRIRLAGPIDDLIFPPGGPQTVPLLRDLILVPVARLSARRLVLHFHAAGIADALGSGGLLVRIVAWLYGRADAAIVMTEYNRRDPLACGIDEVVVVPHRLPDEYDPRLVDRSGDEVRFLSMGHLCTDKGTVALLEAFAKISVRYPNVYLEIAGEPLPPYSEDLLRKDLDRLSIAHRVRLLGVLRGHEKLLAFGRAHAFVFASIAPYESFGLVMAEALMWRLPMAVTRWRGNLDVAGNDVGGVVVEPGEDMIPSLADALERIANERSRWSDWGAKNRVRFESLYRACESVSLAEAIQVSVLSPSNRNSSSRRGST